MKSLVGLILSVLICCCGFAAAQQPLKGKFVAAETLDPQHADNPTYIILKDGFSFSYHSEYSTKNYEYHGDWKYLKNKKIKISFDPPGDVAHKLSSPPIGYIADHTIKVISKDTLAIVFYCPPPIHGNRIKKFIRVPEE